MNKLLSILTITIIGFLPFFSSCNKQHDNPVQPINGTYHGVFSRSSPEAKYAAAHVTLTFAANKFSGTSDAGKYPAICSGTYTLTGNNEVEFFNECAWTADFDWALILEGKYTIEQLNDELIITKAYGGHSFDTYRLKK